MNKIKILFIHHGGFHGGAPRSLSYLIDGLEKCKYNALVLTLVKEPGKEVFTEKGIHILIAKKLYPFHGTTVTGMNTKLFLSNWLRIIPTIVGSFKIIKRVKPDIIHLNSTCLFTFAISAKLVSKKIKVITHVREPLLNGISGKMLKYFNYFFTDWDIPISKYDQSKLVKRKNSTVIYNFVDFTEFDKGLISKSFRVELQLQQDSILFTYIARIARSNGTVELVNMIKPIIKEFSNFHFAIIGFPEYNNKYINKVKKIAEGSANIHLIEFRNDIPNILSATDVFVCPFTVPHFSRGIIEASAMGVPSIGTNIGGVNELIVDGSTGFLYANNIYTEFYNCVKKLGLNDGLRREMGENAYKFAQTHFDSKKNVQAVSEIYNYVLSDKKK